MAKILKKIIPAYPFVQYADDPNVVAFFTAYNDLAQQYLDAVNGLKLPYWPAAGVSGDLLDFIVRGLYGQERPEQQISTETFSQGVYDTVPYNELAYNTLVPYTPGVSEYVPDDFFKRILTWNFYKADGQQFTIPWLKRRIARFLYGPSGKDPQLANTYTVSVTVQDGVYTISYPEVGNRIGAFLKDAINQGAVYLPFQYTYEITVTNTGQ